MAEALRDDGRPVTPLQQCGRVGVAQVVPAGPRPPDVRVREQAFEALAQRLRMPRPAVGVRKHEIAIDVRLADRQPVLGLGGSMPAQQRHSAGTEVHDMGFMSFGGADMQRPPGDDFERADHVQDATVEIHVGPAGSKQLALAGCRS